MGITGRGSSSLGIHWLVACSLVWEKNMIFAIAKSSHVTSLSSLFNLYHLLWSHIFWVWHTTNVINCSSMYQPTCLFVCVCSYEELVLKERQSLTFMAASLQALNFLATARAQVAAHRSLRARSLLLLRSRQKPCIKKKEARASKTERNGGRTALCNPRSMNCVEEKMTKLRRRIPHCESMELDGLFLEVAGHIMCLQLQVKVVQMMVKASSPSESDEWFLVEYFLLALSLFLSLLFWDFEFSLSFGFFYSLFAWSWDC